MSNDNDNKETIFFIADNLKLSKKGDKYYKNEIELKKLMKISIMKIPMIKIPIMKIILN